MAFSASNHFIHLTGRYLPLFTAIFGLSCHADVPEELEPPTPVQHSNGGCGTEIRKLSSPPIDMKLLLDRSGGMRCNAPEGDSAAAALCELQPEQTDPSLPSKWEIVISSLEQALLPLETWHDLRIRTSWFPDDSQSCAIDSKSGTNWETWTDGSTKALITSLNAVHPEGYSPIIGALTVSFTDLITERNSTRSSEELNSLILLISDGKESCLTTEQSDAFLSETQRAFRDYGIRTVVIGGPGSESAKDWLSKLAIAGGSSRCFTAEDAVCHWDLSASPNFATALQETLHTILNGEEMRCQFELDQQQEPLVNLQLFSTSRLNGFTIPQLSGVSDRCVPGVDSWISSRNGKAVIVCGSYCDELLDDPTAELKLQLGCPTYSIEID